MANWKSFYKKHWTPKNKEILKAEAIKKIKERDENLKENWQNWANDNKE